MSTQELPVTIAVRRPDGTVEHIRVGTATPRGAGYALNLYELSIGEAAAPSTYAPRAAPAPGFAPVPSGMVFPPYGRSKGQPIEGATLGDLEFYANGCRRTLNDPAKARWHEKETILLAAIEAEIARQRGEEPMPPEPPPGDDDIPF